MGGLESLSARSLKLSRRKWGLAIPLDAHGLQLADSFCIGEAVVIVGREAGGVGVGLDVFLCHCLDLH